MLFLYTYSSNCGCSFFYSIEKTISLSNPAIIQISELTNYNDRVLDTLSENIGTKGDKSEHLDLKMLEAYSNCEEIKTILSPQIFKNNFKLKVFNPNTKKEFFLQNNYKVQSGNRVFFYFKNNKKGELIINHIFKENLNHLEKLKINSCDQKNLVDEKYEISKDLKIVGKKDGYLISQPLGVDEIIVKFKTSNEENLKTLGVIKLESISTKDLEYYLNSRNWNLQKDHKSLTTKGVEKFYSNQFLQELDNEISWGSNKQKNKKYEEVFIDFNGDKKAEIIAVDKNNDGSYDYYLLDRNNNRVTDAIVFPGIKNDQLIYDWLIDENEDGKFDGYAEDLSGDWQVKKFNNL